MDPQTVAPLAQLQTTNPEIQSALIAASVAIALALVSLLAQVILWFCDKRAQRRHELMEHRRNALLSALQVIDHVYANTSFGGQPPLNLHAWSIALARDAMNGIIIFAKDPDRLLASFSAAVGLHNPAVGPAPAFNPGALAAFRAIVCEELDLRAPNYTNQNMIWIASLPGGI